MLDIYRNYRQQKSEHISLNKFEIFKHIYVLNIYEKIKRNKKYSQLALILVILFFVKDATLYYIYPFILRPLHIIWRFLTVDGEK